MAVCSDGLAFQWFVYSDKDRLAADGRRATQMLERYIAAHRAAHVRRSRASRSAPTRLQRRGQCLDSARELVA